MMFNYTEAFSRNIGWLTESEQLSLINKRIAIAGLGGVGGSHVLTLARLGIGRFNISDLDTFELANMNRQAGASMSTLGDEKIDVLERLAKDINPELDINKFSQGVSLDNLDDFLQDVDVYIDGLDFFQLDIRRAVFKACNEKGIPAITAAPIGMGTALLNFIPGKMSFDEYFQLEGHSKTEQYIRFLAGLAPSMMHVGYIADQSRVDFDNKRGPSTPMACDFCSGIAATQALKILLKRGKIVTAPYGLHFDAYKNKLKKTWRPMGNNNPLQRVLIQIIKAKLTNSKH
jgi:hypothetical protein